MSRLIVFLMFAFSTGLAFPDEIKMAELPKGTVKVVAYLYDYTTGPSKWIMASKDKLHSGIIAKYTKTLSDDDVKLLLDALTEKHSPRQIPICEPAPHHAVVCYDKEQKILATVSICFQCRTLYSSHFNRTRKPMFSFWDWKALQSLFEKNGFPILKDDAEYTNLAAKSPAQDTKDKSGELGGADQPATVPESKPEDKDKPKSEPKPAPR